MKQSTIKLILGTMIILGLLSSLTSCSSSKDDNNTTSLSNTIDSNDTTNNGSSTWVTMRATALGTGITVPVECLRSRDVYNTGDTVWVYQENNRIVSTDPMIFDKELNTGLVDSPEGDQLIIFRVKLEVNPNL